MAKDKTYSKDHVYHWKNRLFHLAYTTEVDGVRQTIKETDWAVRIQYRGRRESFPLRTSNKDAAAIKARDIYLSLVASGWDKTIAQYKPGTIVKINYPTVGEYIREYTSMQVMDRTREGYISMFRKIVADINNLADDRRKYDYKKGGREIWINEIDAVRLDSLTPDKTQKWRIAFISKAGKAYDKIDKATNSANSYIRNARCLFTPEVLKFIKNLELPSPLPFEGIRVAPLKSTEYKSEIDTSSLIELAENELHVAIPDIDNHNLKERREAFLSNEIFKIFFLALGCGLRLNEIDKIQWRSISWDRSTINLPTGQKEALGHIRIETTKWFRPKSKRGRVIYLFRDDEYAQKVLGYLRFYRPLAKDEFIVNGSRPKEEENKYYRCEKVSDALVKWLRKKGIKDQRPIHALRAEFSSYMTQKYGVHFAKRQLGHANVATTENYYIDQNLYTEKPTPTPDVELKARWDRYLEERKVVPD